MNGMQHVITRGSLFGPLTIEPSESERQRLDASLGVTPMTPAERGLRRQWLEDQQLAPDEPRYVPQLYKCNIFTRAYTYPWDVLFWSLRPIIVYTTTRFPL